MTKVQFRRWVVRFVELVICMVIMSIGCVCTALVVSWCLRLLGVG